jgi:hypothetical protein
VPDDIEPPAESSPDIAVIYAADHEAFADPRSRPIRPHLQFMEYPNLGHGWVLWYPDPTDPGEWGEFFVGGDIDSVDWALERAKAHLRLVQQGEDDARIHVVALLNALHDRDPARDTPELQALLRNLVAAIERRGGSWEQPA